MTAVDDLGIDPGTPGFFLQPDYYDVLARLRAEAPVFEYAPATLRRSPATTTSGRSAATRRRSAPGRGALVNDPLREGGTVDGSILHMDPPQHGAWRRLLNREFTARAVERMEDGIRDLARRLLDAVPAGEVVDLVDVLAAPLPVLVICELLGVPDANRPDFRRWSDATILATDGRAALPPEALQDIMELVAFLEQLARDKAASPGDDVVSLLVGAEVDGRPLTPGELVTFNMSLLVAGNETTRHLISGGMMALAEHPDQRVRRGGGPVARSPVRSRSACAG